MNQHTAPIPYPGGPVHFYSFDHPGGTVLFDAGPPTDDGRAALVRSLDFSRLTHVFFTHAHLDHVGGLTTLAEETSAKLVLPGFDRRQLLMDREERVDPVIEIMANLGFPDSLLPGIRESWNGIVDRMPKIDPARVASLEDVTDEAEALGITHIPCPGHSQSDIVYRVGDEAVSGDVMLQGVFQTPLIDAELDTGKRFDNYGAWCGTVENIAGMRKVAFLPGHGAKITDPAALIAFYVRKMAVRAASVRQTESGSVFDAVSTFMGIDEAHREPFKAYIRAGEIVFIRDARKRPDLLCGALERMGLIKELAPQIEALFG